MHEVMKKNQDKYAQVENPEKVADILGISSVMVQDMTGKRFVAGCDSDGVLDAHFFFFSLGSTTTPLIWTL